MRGIAACVTCIGLALMPAAAVGEEKTAGGIELDARQVALIKKVSDYFSDLHTVYGDFVQTSSDNHSMKGKFYVQRPGRFRFDYARPSRQIVISDGQTLAVQDLDLNHEDRVPLYQTLFRLLLQSDVNLVRDAKVMEVEESAGLIAIRLRDNDPNVPGELKLILADKPDLKLKAWWTKNGDGVETRIDVSDLVEGVQLDANLFKIAARSWSE